jgi:hypothetical protein
MTCSLDGSLWVWNLKSGKQIGDDWRDREIGVWTIVLCDECEKLLLSDAAQVKLRRSNDQIQVR